MTSPLVPVPVKLAVVVDVADSLNESVAKAVWSLTQHDQPFGAVAESPIVIIVVQLVD